MKGLTHEQRRDRRRLIADYCKENPVKVTALVWGVTLQQAYAACREFGVTPILSKPRGKLMKFSTLRAVARLQNGERASDIASDMGVSPQAVSEIRKRAVEAGIQMPTRGSQYACESCGSTDDLLTGEDVDLCRKCAEELARDDAAAGGA